MGQKLRVPLDSQDKRVTLAFNPLDDAVLGRGIDDQPLARFFDCLVMGGIDLQILPSYDLLELGPLVDFYSMASAVLQIPLLVLVGLRKLSSNILIKRAPKGDINGLCAAAYAE